MNRELRVLMLEDTPSDAELAAHELRRAGIAFTSIRVEAKDAFVKALDEFHPDIVLSDYKLPNFNGKDALEIVQRNHPEIPVVMVTGALSDIEAVDLIHTGAKDYVLKDGLARLPLAVQRALAAEQDARTRRAAEKALQESEARYRRITEGLTDYQYTVRIENGRAVENTQSPACVTVTGYTPGDFSYNPNLWIQMVAPEDRALVIDHVGKILEGQDVPPIEHRIIRKDGETRWVSDTTILFKDVSGKLLSYDGVIKDITGRKTHEARIHHLNRVLRTISACNEALVRARNEDGLLTSVCRNIVVTGGHLLAWVAYPGESAQEHPRVVTHCGDEKVFHAHAELEHDPEHSRHCLTIRALNERQTVACNQLMSRPECNFGRLRQSGVNSILALPLITDRLNGVLTVFSATPDAFDADETHLMEELAADLAYGIDALRTTRERDQYVSQLGNAMRNTVTAIARTLEMRDPYTAGHQQRVTKLAVSIAREMGQGDMFLEGLYFGAMIHDIGKISVPAEILSKPGKLSDIEFRLIQSHSLTGLEIVQSVDFPWPVAKMIAQHHERLDGSGYPAGLKDNDIILEARIISVADVVEAMSSHRPYRVSLGIDAALEEIEQGKGSHYDPEVVDACLRLFRDKGFIFQA